MSHIIVQRHPSAKRCFGLSLLRVSLAHYINRYILCRAASVRTTCHGPPHPRRQPTPTLPARCRWVMVTFVGWAYDVTAYRCIATDHDEPASMYARRMKMSSLVLVKAQAAMVEPWTGGAAARPDMLESPSLVQWTSHCPANQKPLSARSRDLLIAGQAAVPAAV